MKILTLLIIFLLFLTTSCGRAPDSPAKGATKDLSVKTSRPVDPTAPPTAKEMIRAVLDMQDVSLSAGRFCDGVGTDFTDRNVGDYISGMLAQIGDQKGKNWIQTSARPGTLPDTGEAVWECEVTVRRIKGEEVMNWGVRFKLKASDRSLVNGSIMCIGAG